MTMTLLDHAARGAPPSAAQRLRHLTAAVRVSLKWLGVRKTLTPEQRSQAADTFDAEGAFLSARKKLLDTSHPAYKDVTAVRGSVVRYWKSRTLPYPEPGIRLIRQDQVEAFDAKMKGFQDELDAAVARLDDHYAELKSAARRRLGSLYDPNDYPPALHGLFGIDWNFPSIEPPDYLLQLNPDIYEQEKARVAGRFEEAVQLAEQAFIGELAKLVSHLSERMKAGPEGEKKAFKNTVITNLTEFFARFRDLNVRSNEQLDALVAQAQDIVRGVEPQELRDNDSLRQHIATQLAGVQATLDGMIVNQPRRRIVRSSPSTIGANHAPDR